MSNIYKVPLYIIKPVDDNIFHFNTKKENTVRCSPANSFIKFRELDKYCQHATDLLVAVDKNEMEVREIITGIKLPAVFLTENFTSCSQAGDGRCSPYLVYFYRRRDGKRKKLVSSVFDEDFYNFKECNKKDVKNYLEEHNNYDEWLLELTNYCQKGIDIYNELVNKLCLNNRSCKIEEASRGDSNINTPKVKVYSISKEEQ